MLRPLVIAYQPWCWDEDGSEGGCGVGDDGGVEAGDDGGVETGEDSAAAVPITAGGETEGSTAESASGPCN